MIRFFARLFNLILIASLLFAQAGNAFAQDGGEDEFVARLIAQMSPEAKVGQLFVVSFGGTDTTLNSNVADLILNYRVGGVVLSIQNNNILNGTDTPTQVASLTAGLQNLARQTNRTGNAPFIPLFIATEQDGDGAPRDQITSGLTPQPSPMAIGATWNVDDAEKIGRVVGQELSALGINMLLGPTLDVRTTPSSTPFDPGVHVFGGDPYWVGAMAQAYVRGLRAGSNDRLATVLKNFPGQGSLDSEAYTIDRSLDDLKKIDLPPFLRLMQVPTGKTRPLADALLTTNVRYRGFWGNIRERTRPISLDSDALQTLIGLPEVKAWRDASGLMVSDALGATMVRDYYATAANAGATAQQAALESFQAGNDVLILRNLNTLDTSTDEVTLTRGVINFFRQKYSTDPAFQARVDSAVQRILRLKYRLYPNYDPTKVIVSLTGLTGNIGLAAGRDAATQVADDALTLIYPAPDRLTLPTPKPADVFLIAVDDHIAQDCKTCPARSTLTTDGLAQAIEKQFGVPTQNITTTRFTDLKAFVVGAPNAIDLTNDFNQATWIVLAMQADDPNIAASDAAQTLIDLRPNLLANKHVVGLLFGPPHELSADQLTHFSAVYALYSRTSTFVDAAVKAIAGQLNPVGRSPVNLEELNYDLTVQTEPDPAQVILLSLGDEAVEGQPTPAPVNLRVGDTVRIRTSIILDRNGHAVPDGTPVRFTFQYGNETTASTSQTGPTLNGVARAEFTLDRVGLLFIRASSEPALSSITIQISIGGPGGVGQVATLLPPTPTFTPAPSPIRPNTPTPTITPTPEPTFLQSVVDRSQRANWSELIFALLGAVLISSVSLWQARSEQMELTQAVQSAIWAAIGGMLAYLLFALGILASAWLRSIFGVLAALLITVIGGWLTLLWQHRKI